ncbi:MAG: Chromosome partition protein Smc [Mycoplasmataceae bacterium]|nr:MAG: Chromosome partition protein Smc [Mycoplasmataceae bacterium]
MIIETIALILTITIGYFGHEKFLADKLDSPRNNEVVKGLDKQERKDKIKEIDTELKQVKTEIKDLDTERKALLKDENKKEEAQEKLEAKEEKQTELTKLEADLKDLKTVDKGGYMAYVPNKLNLNNGLWIGGSLLAMFLFYSLCVGILSKTLPKNWTQANSF